MSSKVPIPRDGVKPSECSLDKDLPHEGTYEDGVICSSAKDIIEVASVVAGEINIKNLENLSDNSKKAIKDKKAVLDEIKGKVGAEGCHSESCILKYVENNASVEGKSKVRKIVDNVLNPSGPFDSVDWLSNHNIDNVLNKVAKKYKYFYHIDYKMKDEFVDSECILNNLDMKSLCQKYKCIGVVANQDVRSGPGIHWVALFIDFRHNGTPGDEYTIEFFNSAGGPIYTEMMVWMKKIQKDLFMCGKESKIIQASKIQHQYRNSECGVYSIFYIWCRVDGMEWNSFEYKRIPDDKMVQFRKGIFRHS